MAKMHKLTDRQVKHAKREIGDGGGLTLNVTKDGSKSWSLLFTSPTERRRREMRLGSYPDVGLSEAREKAADARKLIAQGIDPIEAKGAAKKAEKRLPTFGDIAKDVIADAQAKTVNPKVAYQWTRHLGPAFAGALLDRPVNQITTVEIARVLAPLRDTKPEVARKVHPAIHRVFDRARVILRDDHGVEMTLNPANLTDLKALGYERPKELTRGHQAALPYAQMSAFMSELRTREAVSARALEFLILTAVRTDPVLKARWDQVDLDGALWVIPLANLKDREHRTEAFRVPLSPRAVEIVREMAPARTASPYVFPGQSDSVPPSNMALLLLLQRMNSEPKWLDEDGRAITPHGFRATFKTWCEEVATFPHAVVETSLGHKVGGKVERAYTRTDLLNKRRELMGAWARHCDPTPSAGVIQLRPKSA